MVKAKVRPLSAAAFASPCISLSLGSQLKSGIAAPKQPFQIRISNLARVPNHDLSRVEDEVTRIFADAR
jgi:hypothetical protein